MFSIWPFRPKTSRLQQLKNTLGDVVDGAEHAIHEVAESASEALHSATKIVVPAVVSSVSNVTEITADAAHTVSQKVGNASETAAKSAKRALKNLHSRGESATESAHDFAVKGAQSAAKTAASQTSRAQKSWNAARETSSTRVHDFAQNVATAGSELKKNTTQKAANIAQNTAKTAHQTTEDLGEHAHDAQQNLASSLSALVAAVLAARANVGEHLSHHNEESKDDTWRFSLPEIHLPKIELPKVELPKVELPKVELPKVALPNVSQATSQLGSKLQDTRENSARRARDAASRFTNEPTYNELRLRIEKLSSEKTGGDSRFLWLAFGILGGVVLALLLAPNSGRRSRAALRDKIGKAGKGAKSLGKSAARKKTDLGNRIEGKLRERASQKTEDVADDITIADRVRTALGENEATSNLERINVDCVNGLVTLRGPIVEGELQAQIEIIVRGVRGVRDVRSDLLISDAPEDTQTFVG